MSFGRPNPLKLDSMQMIDTVMANQYFGRTDVPEPQSITPEALQDVVNDKDPELDRTLPWPLLVRGMFKILYKDQLRDLKKRRGRAWAPGDPMPTTIVLTPRAWADSFNFITVSYVKAQIFKRPRIIEKRETVSGRNIALALLLQDPGKGRDKMNYYLGSGERRRTVKIMRRMDKHRNGLAEMGPVKKYIAGMQAPANIN